MEDPEIITPEKSPFKRVLRVIKWIVVSVLLFLISGLILVFVYEDEVKGVIVKELNKHLKTEVRIDPKNIDLTFVSSFPDCAIEFKNFAAMETWNRKQKDTLLFASSLSLKFSIKDLFNERYNIRKIELDGARCDMKVDKNGKLNYEVWKTVGEELKKRGHLGGRNIENALCGNSDRRRAIAAKRKRMG